MNKDLKHFVVATAVLGFLVVVSIIAGALESSPLQFTVTPDVLYINWSSEISGDYWGNFTVSNSRDFIIGVEVVNALPQVTLKNSTNSKPAFTVFNGTSNSKNIYLGASPSSGIFSLVFDLGGLASGRYSGKIPLADASNANINVSGFSVILDVPVTFDSENKGYFSGNVTELNKEVFFFDPSSKPNVAGFSVKFLNIANLQGLGVKIYDSAGALRSGRVLENTLLFNDTSVFPLKSGYWKLEVSNTSTESGFTGLVDGSGFGYFDASVELLKPSLRVHGTGVSGRFKSGALTFKNNIERNGTFSSTILLNNTAGYNLSISTVSNSLSLDNGGSYVNFSTNLSSYSDFNVTPGSVLPILVSVSLDTSTTSNAQGTYTGWLLFTSTNGYPFESYNLTVTMDLTSELMIYVSDASSKNGDEWISNVGLDDAVNSTFSVKYLNGDAFNGLDSNDFSLFLSRPSGPKESDTDLSSGKVLSALGGGLYSLNASVSSSVLSALPGGDYKVRVAVKNNSLSSSNESTDLVRLNSTGLYLTSFTVSSSSFNVESTADVTAKVKNIGNINASDVGVSLNLGGCVALNSGSAAQSKYVSSKSFSDNEATYVWTIKGTGAGTCSVTVNGTATESNKWFVPDDRSSLSVSVSRPADTTDLSDPSRYDTPEEKNYIYDMSIAGLKEYATVKQGQNLTISFSVKNLGNIRLSGISVIVSGIDSKWIVLPDNFDIDANSNRDIDLGFTVPNDASVGNYSVFVRVVAGDLASYQSKIILIVLPGEALRESISKNIKNYGTLYEELAFKRDEMKKVGGDTGAIDLLLDEAKNLLEKADAYRVLGEKGEEDKWLLAHQLMSQIKALLGAASSDLELVKEENVVSIGGFEIARTSYNNIMGLVTSLVFIGIVIGGAYLAMPARHGYKYGVGYSNAGEHAGRARIYALIEKIKKMLGLR